MSRLSARDNVGTDEGAFNMSCGAASFELAFAY